MVKTSPGVALVPVGSLEMRHAAVNVPLIKFYKLHLYYRRFLVIMALRKRAISLAVFCPPYATLLFQEG